MAIDVETKDCTSLSDSELAEMADMCAEGLAGFDVGLISKQPEAWVLITLARDRGRVLGFSFSTLERIGGTPCVLWGVASVARVLEREDVLKAITNDQFRRAVLAFPDEDVLVGTRFIDPSGYEAFQGLEDVVPRPGHKASGEERAWGRRLAKRFGAEGRIDDRTFVVTGDGSPAGVLDIEARKPELIAPDVAAFFGGLDHERHDYIISFGWAMAEDLASWSSPG